MPDYHSPLSTDYQAKYDDAPRRDLVSLITESPGSVLEIGCGTGATGALIKKKFSGTWYVGGEIDEGAAVIAQRRLDRAFAGNIEQIDLREYGLAKESFDLIICADVLEHLYDPWRVVRVLRDYLKPAGCLLASIPNAQNINLILHLLNGHWTYSKHGLLDATHIRFFTLSEIVKLFSGTGYEIVRCANNLQQEPEGEGWPRDLALGRVLLRDISREEAERLYTFQYLIIARKRAL